MAQSFDGRGKSRNKNKMRNLAQYKDMSDEEFNLLMAEETKSLGIETSKQLEKRIEEKLEMFSKDYDLSDLKINDREILRGMIQAIISLEDYEQYLWKIREEGINPDNIILIDKIQKVISDIRGDISKFQNDLNITRKVRKSDQETSVIAYIEGLKEKARKFYESRMSYIFCPKCNTLLGTIWTLYPESDKNKISLTCYHENPDGTLCNEKVVVGTKEMLAKRGTNNKEILPESLL